MLSRLTRVTICLLIVARSLTVQADGMSHNSREDQLKAGYIFNFAKFVEWPNLAPSDTMTICFLGGIGIREAFVSSSAGKQVANHPVITRAVAVRSGSGCQMLFVAADAPTSSDAMSPNNSAMLSVGEDRDFVRRGGIIELFTEDNRLRFNINLDNARRAGLKISSNLLQLASHVEETGR